MRYLLLLNALVFVVNLDTLGRTPCSPNIIPQRVSNLREDLTRGPPRGREYIVTRCVKTWTWAHVTPASGG